uniref:Uncharacterized protein n=1 Tax=Eutreptiella gymnastica TaxID=73025 RepID=A0A7S1N333_9EUGL
MKMRVQPGIKVKGSSNKLAYLSPLKDQASLSKNFTQCSQSAVCDISDPTCFKNEVWFGSQGLPKLPFHFTPQTCMFGFFWSLGVVFEMLQEVSLPTRCLLYVCS